jgi:hypothetical protein
MGQHLTLVDVRQAIVDRSIELLGATLARKSRVGAGALEAAKPEGFDRAERARWLHALRGRPARRPRQASAR